MSKHEGEEHIEILVQMVAPMIGPGLARKLVKDMFKSSSDTHSLMYEAIHKAMKNRDDLVRDELAESKFALNREDAMNRLRLMHARVLLCVLADCSSVLAQMAGIKEDEFLEHNKVHYQMADEREDKKKDPATELSDILRASLGGHSHFKHRYTN